ncbi:glycosyltransferase [Candidatus Woesearchaeota archaeon]|nr:glycosyltransferase [Candidatus Woesearchaeota archaeon]
MKRTPLWNDLVLEYKLPWRYKKTIDYSIKSINTKIYELNQFFSKKTKPKNTDKKVSIIIPTLSKGNQADHFFKLKKLLIKYLPNQTYHNYEAIVLCDGSNPKVENMVKSLKDRRIRLFISEKTLGFWGHPLTRKGIELAKGDYFVRMNDDNIPYKNYLAELVEGFREDIGVVYGRVVYKETALKAHGNNFIGKKSRGIPNNMCTFTIPRDKSGKILRTNIDCMCYLVKINLAKKYVDSWDNSFAADWFFIEKLLNEGVKYKFIDKLIGVKR